MNFAHERSAGLSEMEYKMRGRFLEYTTSKPAIVYDPQSIALSTLQNDFLKMAPTELDKKNHVAFASPTTTGVRLSPSICLFVIVNNPLLIARSPLSLSG